MDVKTNTMPIQENQSIVKWFAIAANSQPYSMQHLTPSNRRSDLARNNAEIETVNGLDVKDSMFCLHRRSNLGSLWRPEDGI